jgi:thioredoxin 1
VNSVKIAVFFAVALAMLGLMFTGCASSTDAGEETSGKPVVIDFWRPGCPPCDAMEPVLAQLEEEYGDRVDIVSYNTMEERGKAEKYGITAVPTFIFIDADGTVIYKVVGQQSLGFMRDKIESLLASPE